MSQNKPENQIDYIEIPASDIAATKQFYSAAFGWKFEDYGPNYTSFHDGRLAGGFWTEVARRRAGCCWYFIRATSQHCRPRSKLSAERS